jgi:hypothetical protein
MPVIRGDRVNPVPQLGAETGWIPVKMQAIQIRLIWMPWWCRCHWDGQVRWDAP